MIFACLSVARRVNASPHYAPCEHISKGLVRGSHASLPKQQLMTKVMWLLALNQAIASVDGAALPVVSVDSIEEMCHWSSAPLYVHVSITALILCTIFAYLIIARRFAASPHLGFAGTPHLKAAAGLSFTIGAWQISTGLAFVYYTLATLASSPSSASGSSRVSCPTTPPRRRGRRFSCCAAPQ